MVAEFAALLTSYSITQLIGDRWGGGFHADAWRRNGIDYRACEQTTSEIYLSALPLLLSGRARLLDDAVLQRQLTGLERRVHAGGRESVSHAAAASAHDDVAAAVCGALVAAAASACGYDVSMNWVDTDTDVAPADASAVAADAERLGRFASQWQKRNYMLYCATGGFTKPPWAF